MEVALGSGDSLRAPLHNDFRAKVRWKGRCIDLTKAYKQMPVSVPSRQFSVLMLHHHETGTPVYFLSSSIPFGASSSVFGFNRVSRSIHHIASVACKILGGVFFDDYPLFEPDFLCGLAAKSFEWLLSALGWLFSNDPKKTFPFAESFDVLGAKLTVGDLHGGPFTVENKPKRLVKIGQLIADLGASGRITKRQAQVVQGNLNFATSFVMGRSLKVASRAFASLTTGKNEVSASELGDLCAWTAKLIAGLQGRQIDPRGRPEPVLVFTDAAYEADVATWGIVILDPVSKLRTALGGRIPPALVDKWHSLGSRQVITQASQPSWQGWLSTRSCRDAGPFSSWTMKALASP